MSQVPFSLNTHQNHTSITPRLHYIMPTYVHEPGITPQSHHDYTIFCLHMYVHEQLPSSLNTRQNHTSITLCSTYIHEPGTLVSEHMPESHLNHTSITLYSTYIHEPGTFVSEHMPESHHNHTIHIHTTLKQQHKTMSLQW